MKVICENNHIGSRELEDRILSNLTVGENYEVEYEFTATNGINSKEMYFIKDKGPFEKSRFKVAE